MISQERKEQLRILRAKALYAYSQLDDENPLKRYSIEHTTIQFINLLLEDNKKQKLEVIE